ncbi:MAG: hypothetical protein NZ898_15795, partial [Myxococcota bacterium]|nr:hypothetical protein [Myxococcota bacterium]
VQGRGLRVELNWDTMLDSRGGTDVDLHLHRWTRNGIDTDWFTDDDCYYANCQPENHSISWPDHPDSDLSNCADAPRGGGADWRARGGCANPRLDVDTNGTDGPCNGAVTDPSRNDFCAPENINVDEPIPGRPYRILVNYYNDHGHPGMTNVSVNVYCGGALRASFGLDPLVYLRNGTRFGAANDNWHVADVVFVPGVCGLDCVVYPLGMITRGTPDPADPFGLTARQEFLEPWSCDHDPVAGTCTPR